MEELSPYAKFMAALCGWIVVDKTTQRPVPKFILWEHFGHNPEQIAMISTRIHEKFDYINRQTRFKLAQTEQLLNKQPFEL